jgi:hypothetical protein
MSRPKCPHCGGALIRVFNRKSGELVMWLCIRFGCRKKYNPDLTEIQP